MRLQTLRAGWVGRSDAGRPGPVTVALGLAAPAALAIVAGRVAWASGPRCSGPVDGGHPHHRHPRNVNRPPAAVRTAVSTTARTCAGPTSTDP
jgi:hypothetical protein